MPSRTARYSGNERPAWRMNHTGVCATGSRRQAARNVEEMTAADVVGVVEVTGPSCHVGPRNDPLR